MEVCQVLQANGASIAWCGTSGEQRGVFEYQLPSTIGNGGGTHRCVVDCGPRLSSPTDTPAAMAWNRRQTLVAVATGPTVTVAAWPSGQVLYACTPTLAEGAVAAPVVTHVAFEGSGEEQDALFFSLASNEVCFVRLPPMRSVRDDVVDTIAVHAAIAVGEDVIGIACGDHPPLSCCVVLARSVLSVIAVPVATTRSTEDVVEDTATGTSTSFELHRTEPTANDDAVLDEKERFTGCGVGPHHTILASTNRRLCVYTLHASTSTAAAAPVLQRTAIVPLDALGDRADELCSVAWDPWAGDASTPACVAGVWTIDRCLRVYHVFIDAQGRVGANDFLGELSPLSGDEDVVWCGALGAAKSVVIARRTGYGFMGLEAVSTSTAVGDDAAGVVAPLETDEPCEDSVEVADEPLDAAEPANTIESTTEAHDPVEPAPTVEPPPVVPAPPVEPERTDDAVAPNDADTNGAAAMLSGPPDAALDEQEPQTEATAADEAPLPAREAPLESAGAEDVAEPIPQTEPASANAGAPSTEHTTTTDSELPGRDEEASTTAPPHPPPTPPLHNVGGTIEQPSPAADKPKLKDRPPHRAPPKPAATHTAASSTNGAAVAIRTRPVSPSIPPPEKKPAVPRLSEALKRQSRAERLAHQRSADEEKQTQQVSLASASGGGMGIAASPDAARDVPPRGPGVDVALDTHDLADLRDRMDVYVLTKLLGEGWETPVSFIALPPQVKLADLRRRLEALHNRRLSITFATTDGKLIELRPSTLNLFQNYDDATKQIYCRGLFPTFPAKSKWDSADQRAHSAMDSTGVASDEDGFGRPRSVTPGGLQNISAISTAPHDSSGMEHPLPSKRLTKEEQIAVSRRLHEESMEQSRRKVEMLTKTFWPEEAQTKSIAPEAAAEMIERLYRRSNEHKAQKIRELQKTVDASIFGTKPHVQLTEAERNDVAMKFYNAGVRQAQRIAEEAERRQHPKPRCKKLSGPEEWAAWQESMARDIGKKYKSKDPYAGA